MSAWAWAHLGHSKSENSSRTTAALAGPSQRYGGAPEETVGGLPSDDHGDAEDGQHPPGGHDAASARGHAPAL